MYGIDDVLKRFSSKLNLILVKIEGFMNLPSIELLKEISDDFITLGNMFYDELAFHNHRVLSVIALDAGLKIREKYRDKRDSDLNTMDIDYIRDIYEVFKKIAEKIEEGEYSKHLDMMARRKADN